MSKEESPTDASRSSGAPSTELPIDDARWFAGFCLDIYRDEMTAKDGFFARQGFVLGVLTLFVIAWLRFLQSESIYEPLSSGSTTIATLSTLAAGLSLSVSIVYLAISVYPWTYEKLPMPHQHVELFLGKYYRDLLDSDVARDTAALCARKAFLDGLLKSLHRSNETNDRINRQRYWYMGRSCFWLIVSLPLISTQAICLEWTTATFDNPVDSAMTTGSNHEGIVNEEATARFIGGATPPAPTPAPTDSTADRP